MSRWHRLLLVVVVCGLAVRFALSWVTGTEDTHYFRLWSAHALRAGLVHVYSLTDREVVEVLRRRVQGLPVHVRPVHSTDLGPLAGVPDYPPGNILTLQLSAALCRALQGGKLRAGPLLNACLNLAPILASLGIVVSVWRFGQRESWIPAGGLAAFWLHPAAILTSPVLGYQDPIFALLGLLALMLCYRRQHTGAVFVLALACLTKPQGALVVPIVAMAIFADGGWHTLRRCAGILVASAFITLLPFIVEGRLLGVFAGVSQQLLYPPLSAQQLNAWWLVGGWLQATGDASWSGLLSNGVQMVTKVEFASRTGFHPLWIALPLFLLFTAVNLHYLHRHLRAGNRWSIFWAAALEVLGYNMLMVYTHEHHLYAFFVYALPLLGGQKRSVVRFIALLSGTYGLNLFLFDGFGWGHKDVAAWFRTLAGFDLTILVALVNVALFVVLLQARQWWFDGVAPRQETAAA